MLKIIQGSCDDLNIVNKYEDFHFDLLFTSPPYNTGIKQKKTQKYISLESDNNKDYCNWLVNIIKLWLNKAKVVMINIQELANNKIDLIKLMYELKDYYIDRFYWIKPAAIPAGKGAMTNLVEWVLVFSKINKGKTVKVNKELNYLTNIINASQNKKTEWSEIHKAIMSQSFSDQVINTFCAPNSKVIDIFGGLGTTAISCIKNNCECVLIEKEHLYVNKCNERLDKFMKSKNLTDNWNEQTIDIEFTERYAPQNEFNIIEKISELENKYKRSIQYEILDNKLQFYYLDNNEKHIIEVFEEEK